MTPVFTEFCHFSVILEWSSACTIDFPSKDIRDESLIPVYSYKRWLKYSLAPSALEVQTMFGMDSLKTRNLASLSESSFVRSATRCSSSLFNLRSSDCDFSSFL